MRREALDELRGDAGSGQTATPQSISRVTGEIGLRSALGIRFDRAFLDTLIQQGAFESTITIRAQYIRGGRAETLEVPGYSEVGQDRRQARILAVARHPRLLRRAFEELKQQLSDIQVSIMRRESGIAQRDTAITNQVRSVQRELDTLTRGLADASVREQEFLASYEAIVQKAPAESSTVATLQSELRNAGEKLREASSSRAVLDARVRKAREDASLLVRDAERSRFDQQRLDVIAQIYLDARDELLTLIEQLTSSRQ